MQTILKNSIILIVSLCLLTSCRDYFEEYYESDIETLDMSMWDYLQSNEDYSEYVDLLKKYALDSIFSSDNSYTLFVPSNQDLAALSLAPAEELQMIQYSIIPTVVNIQSVSESVKLQTLLEKFALLEKAGATFTYDGEAIVGASSLFNNGHFYNLENYVIPPLSLYEKIEQTSQIFSHFIDLQDSTYFDIEQSTPLGFDTLGNTIYDSVFTTVNTFGREFFPVNEEFRDESATFLLFTQEQYDMALDVVALDLGLSGKEEVPDVWQNEILLPHLVISSIFENSLTYDDFEEGIELDEEGVPYMKNIKGDPVVLDINNINDSSRYICSNGVTFTLNDFSIPEELYKAQSLINGYEQVVLVSASTWDWSDEVIVEGLEGSGAELVVNPYAKLDMLNDECLDLRVPPTFDGTFKVSFMLKGVFGGTYRLLWAGTKDYSGKYKIYVNDVPLKMRNYMKQKKSYFDSYEFSEDRIVSILDDGTYSNLFEGQLKQYNTVDFMVENITEYTDVKITFEYVGPSKGVGANNGLVIDYLQLELVE